MHSVRSATISSSRQESAHAVQTEDALEARLDAFGKQARVDREGGVRVLLEDTLDVVHGRGLIWMMLGADVRRRLCDAYASRMHSGGRLPT